MEKVQEYLNLLEDYMAKEQAMNLDKQALIDAVLTPEVKQHLSDIEAEFAEKSATIRDQIEYLTGIVKKNVIEAGETVKGDHLQAVYVKGRTSWDSKKLEGLAIAIPQVLEARKIGNPSVSIRKVG